MPRRVSLPISEDKRLSLARARDKLGGRVGEHGRAGDPVEIVHHGATRQGVILWSDDASCDVWLGDEACVRVPLDVCAPAALVTGSPLLRISRAARAFAALREGTTVQAGDGPVKLVEKCRWGALVASADGRIFALGFHRLAPN